MGIVKDRRDKSKVSFGFGRFFFTCIHPLWKRTHLGISSRHPPGPSTENRLTLDGLSHLGESEVLHQDIIRVVPQSSKSYDSVKSHSLRKYWILPLRPRDPYEGLLMTRNFNFLFLDHITSSSKTWMWDFRMIKRFHRKLEISRHRNYVVFNKYSSSCVTGTLARGFVNSLKLFDVEVRWLQVLLSSDNGPLPSNTEGVLRNNNQDILFDSNIIRFIVKD